MPIGSNDEILVHFAELQVLVIFESVPVDGTKFIVKRNRIQDIASLQMSS